MTQLSPRVFTAPEPALWDDLSMFYPCTVTKVHWSERGQMVGDVTWGEQGSPPVMGKVECSVNLPVVLLYPKDMVEVDGKSTPVFPFGLGATIKSHLWKIGPGRVGGRGL